MSILLKDPAVAQDLDQVQSEADRYYTRLLCSKSCKLCHNPYWRNGVNGVNLLGREDPEADADAPSVPYTRAVTIPIGLDEKFRHWWRTIGPAVCPWEPH